MSLLFVASNVEGQTLFASPDTSPDYPRYHYIEQCLQAGVRVTVKHRRAGDSIWVDTLTRELKEKLFRNDLPIELRDRRPEAAIDTIKLCLKDFNPDTVNITSVMKLREVVRVLLFAHRDEDADRFAQRFLDSVKNDADKNGEPKGRKQSLDDFKKGMFTLFNVYSGAQPIRLDVARKYYNRYLAARSLDSAYYTIDAAIGMWEVERQFGDSLLKKGAGDLAIRLNDSIPELERPKMPDGVKRLGDLVQMMVDRTKEEALDSLSVSTLAYNLWFRNTVSLRIYGGERVTAEKAKPKKLSGIGGAFYYVADNMSPDTKRDGLASYSRMGPLPGNELPIQGKINWYQPMPGICHPQTGVRWSGDLRWKQKCGNSIGFGAFMRHIKREFPEIEIIGLAATYGTVGHLRPLTPAQEGDTLAKYNLGFLHIPARLIVEETEFFKLESPDDRRIDISTPNSEVLQMSVLDRSSKKLTDKEGMLLEIVPSVGASWFKRFYEILRDRPTPKE